MKKIARHEIKELHGGLKRGHLEVSDYCLNCLQETDISELNLSTGICTTCKPNIKKLDKKTIERLIGLYD
jgi:hypothetical protein